MLAQLQVLVQYFYIVGIQLKHMDAIKVLADIYWVLADIYWALSMNWEALFKTILWKSNYYYLTVRDEKM